MGSVRCYAASTLSPPGCWCWSSSAATPWPPSSPPCPSPHTRTCGRCRSAAAKMANRGWPGCTARAEVQAARDRAADAGEDTAELDDLIAELDQELTRSGLRG